MASKNAMSVYNKVEAGGFSNSQAILHEQNNEDLQSFKLLKLKNEKQIKKMITFTFLDSEN